MKVDIPRNPWDIEIGSHVALDAGVILLSTGPRVRLPRIRIGSGTYCNRHVFIDASQEISIGSNCMIGPFCYITDHDHGTAANELISVQEFVSSPVRIGSNVWIGAGATLLKGTVLGDGAVVGAGAVVTKEVGQGEVVAGVPARRVRTRQPLTQVRKS